MARRHGLLRDRAGHGSDRARTQRRGRLARTARTARPLASRAVAERRDPARRLRPDLGHRARRVRVTRRRPVFGPPAAHLESGHGVESGLAAREPRRQADARERPRNRWRRDRLSRGRRRCARGSHPPDPPARKHRRCGPGEARLGSGGQHRIFEDLHARGLSRRDLPAAIARTVLSVPSIRVRRAGFRQARLRARDARAAAVGSRRRRAGPDSWGRPT